MSRRLAAAVLLLLALLLAGCGSYSTKESRGEDVSTGAGDNTTQDCDPTAPTTPPAPKQYKKPKQVLHEGSTYALVIDTTCGKVTVLLDPVVGGAAANSVAFLAKQGFYNSLTFHRVVPGFVAQGGDPEGSGAGGPGYTVKAKPPAGTKYTVGDMAMAKTDAEPPGTAGSQFFLISGPDGAALPPDYALVGHATDDASLATIKKIDALGVGDAAPTFPVYIKTIKLEEIG